MQPVIKHHGQRKPWTRVLGTEPSIPGKVNLVFWEKKEAYLSLDSARNPGQTLVLIHDDIEAAGVEHLTTGPLVILSAVVVDRHSHSCQRVDVEDDRGGVLDRTI